MSQRFDSRGLRRVAEELVGRLTDEFDIDEARRDELVTSLVRQWVTYDGHACFFLDADRQVYLDLRRTPLGEPYVAPEWVNAGWTEWLARDWKVEVEDLTQVLDDLNRGQAGELVTSDGVVLRIFVDPKDRKRGVEAVDEAERLRRQPPDYPRIAASALAPHLSPAVSATERERLAASVAAQWRRYDGHAGLFLDGRRLLAVRLHLRGDGTCEVGVERVAVNLGPMLAEFGLGPVDLPEVLAGLNLGEDLKVQDRDGIPHVLWFHPEERRFRLRRPDAGPGGAAGAPVQCPRCTAVLRPWRAGERTQTCRFCGHDVTLS